MRYAMLLAPALVGLIISSCAPLPPKHEVTYTVQCEATNRFHRSYDYYHVPAAVDTQSTSPSEAPDGQFLVGYENEWKQSGIGGVNHRYLGFAYRGFIFCDNESLPKKGLVISATLQMDLAGTENWMGSSASNTGSAARKFYRLTEHFSGFSSSGDFLSDLPTTTGATSNATYSPGEGLSITLTTTMNRIVNGYETNHGFMLVGTNESYQHNNDRFLTYYTAPVLRLVVLEDEPQWPSP